MEPPEPGYGGDSIDVACHCDSGVANSCKEEKMSDLLWSDRYDYLETWSISLRGAG